MRMKRILILLVVLGLLGSLLPVQLSASAEEIVTVEIPRVHRIQNRSSGEFHPPLSEGNHASYLDRLANVPEYALNFYRWLEDNASADGVLGNPAKATSGGGGYYHTVEQHTGMLTFTYDSVSEIAETADTLASEAMDRAFREFHGYAGAMFDVFDREHPEIFWLDGGSSYNYSGYYTYNYFAGKCTVYYFADMLFWLQYPGFDIRAAAYRSPKAIADGTKLCNDAIADILADCPKEDPQAQIRYLNKALTWRNAYNRAGGEGKWSQAHPEAWESISALVGRSGNAGPVCEGYARAFAVLCRKVGIPCVLVDGVARADLSETPLDHMWNYVQLEGQWYAVDVTWNDPFVQEMPDWVRTGFENDDWLLLGSESMVAPGLTFLQSHVVENNVDNNGLCYVNGPVLADSHYVPGAHPTFCLSGNVLSSGAADQVLTLTLNGDQTLGVSGCNVPYSFSGLEPDSYTLTASKDGHCPRSYDVTVTDSDVTLDIKLCLYGDVSGEGKRNMGDVAKIFAYIRKGTSLSDDYALACADVTKDDRINMGDVAKVFSHVRGKLSLW